MGATGLPLRRRGHIRDPGLKHLSADLTTEIIEVARVERKSGKDRRESDLPGEGGEDPTPNFGSAVE